MSGGGFILAINLSVATLIAAAFSFIAAYDNRAAAPRWIALSYGLGIAYVLLEFAVGLFSGSKILVVAAYMSFAFGLACMNVGIARKYGQPLPKLVLTGLLVLSLATILWHKGAPQLFFWPMLFYQLPYALLHLPAAFIVLRSPKTGVLDYLLVAILLGSAVHFLSKPMIALAIGTMGDTPSAYMTTEYALFSQTISAIFFLTLALTIMIIMMRDMLGAMALKSETDSLSGTFNRRGFEEKAAVALRNHAMSQTPVAMILSDLDYFKSVNDTYGHATGDMVITAFARLLTQASNDGQIIGRVGGEEFAILYPRANLQLARSFAEDLRVRFAALPIEGAPSGRLFTASFGVAMFRPRESIQDLMALADVALYAAKTAGRDCVRVMPITTENSPDTPRHAQIG